MVIDIYKLLSSSLNWHMSVICPWFLQKCFWDDLVLTNSYVVVADINLAWENSITELENVTSHLSQLLVQMNLFKLYLKDTAVIPQILKMQAGRKLVGKYFGWVDTFYSWVHYDVVICPYVFYWYCCHLTILKFIVTWLYWNYWHLTQDMTMHFDPSEFATFLFE